MTKKPRPMTPEEFAERMSFHTTHGDTETAHYEADLLMCELLRQLGYGEGAKIFEAMPKWYA